MMRTISLAAMAATITGLALSLGGARDAGAAPYSPNPWCLKASMGRGWAVDLCYFRTFEQCNNERFNYGSTSFCIHNPEYVFAKAAEEERRKARRRNQ